MNTEKLIAVHLAASYAQTLSHKVHALQRLDRRAKQVPRRMALALGTLAMCVTMAGIVLSQEDLSHWGLALELPGILLMGVNPLLYERILASIRRRYAWDVVALAKEIWEAGTETI